MGQKLVKQRMTNWWWKSLKCSLLFGGPVPNLTTTLNRSLAELPNVEIFCSKTKTWKSLEEHKCLTKSQSLYSNISNKKHDVVSLKKQQNN